MPRYFFDTSIDDDVQRDDTGLVLLSLKAARGQAAQTLCELVLEYHARLRSYGRISVVVRELDGRTALTAEAVLTVTPPEHDA